MRFHEATQLTPEHWLQLERDRLLGQAVSYATARGPLSLERLHALGGQEALASPDARLRYRLPEPDLQGRTALLLSPRPNWPSTSPWTYNPHRRRAPSGLRLRSVDARRLANANGPSRHLHIEE